MVCNLWLCYVTTCIDIVFYKHTKKYTKKISTMLYKCQMVFEQFEQMYILNNLEVLLTYKWVKLKIKKCTLDAYNWL